MECLIAHVKANTPPGVTATATPLAFRAYPYLVPDDEPGLAVVCEVLVGPGMAGAALSLQTWAVMLGDHSSRSGASLRASCPGLEESVRWVTSMRG